MKKTKRKPRCANCEYANTLLAKRPFVFCYVKWRNKLRCCRCRDHRFIAENDLRYRQSV